MREESAFYHVVVKAALNHPLKKAFSSLLLGNWSHSLTLCRFYTRGLNSLNANPLIQSLALKCSLKIHLPEKGVICSNCIKTLEMAVQFLYNPDRRGKKMYGKNPVNESCLFHLKLKLCQRDEMFTKIKAFNPCLIPMKARKLILCKSCFTVFGYKCIYIEVLI